MPCDPTPLNFAPDALGDELLVTAAGDVVRCVLVPAPPVYDPARVGFRSHWTRCPKADHFKARVERAKQAKAEREAARQEKEPERLNMDQITMEG